VTHRGNINFTYKKKTDNMEVEQYAKWREENPGVWPGPQHYWKTMPPRKGKPRKKDEDPPTEDKNGNKLYLMDRKKTDKVLYKPMKRHIF
jgi:hypothetical protein